MSDIDIIENSLIKKLKTGASSGKLLLVEPAERDYPKTQVRANGKFLVYSFDGCKNLFPYFNCKDNTKLCSINDYFLFYLKNDTLFVIVCELKSNSTKKIQLHLAMPFVQFIISRIEITNKMKFKKVEYRKWLISKKLFKFSKNVYDENGICYLKAGQTVKINDYLI